MKRQPNHPAGGTSVCLSELILPSPKDSSEIHLLRTVVHQW